VADDETGDRVQPGRSDQRAFEGHICVESAGDLLRRRERGAEVIDPGLSAGSEHPDDLVEAGRGIVPVVEAEGGDDEVDGIVRERQRSDVADPEAQVTCAGSVGGRGGPRDSELLNGLTPAERHGLTIGLAGIARVLKNQH
jgi:hypothetical protein